MSSSTTTGQRHVVATVRIGERTAVGRGPGTAVLIALGNKVYNSRTPRPRRSAPRSRRRAARPRPARHRSPRRARRGTRSAHARGSVGPRVPSSRRFPVRRSAPSAPSRTTAPDRTGRRTAAKDCRDRLLVAACSWSAADRDRPSLIVNLAWCCAAILGERVSGLGVRRLTVATRPRWRRAGTLAGRASRQTAGLHDQPLRRAVVGAVARTPDPAGEVRRAVVGRAVAAGGMQATGAGTTETDTGAAAAVASSCVPAPGPRR